jgi:hypothetical protein
MLQPIECRQQYDVDATLATLFTRDWHKLRCCVLLRVRYIQHTSKYG